ncbi:hypothetical protein Dsin_024391 [Dipteronia sinensis]|uniref:Uncharacterized protein n=1 Tax=Dipteronia sinensis TaxID=43782 RepID=A0AAE0DW81_9ROSI|nr:hypothetical protein Dsin_024391 [Dipteronia sinensis]
MAEGGLLNSVGSRDAMVDLGKDSASEVASETLGGLGNQAGGDSNLNLTVDYGRNDEGCLIRKGEDSGIRKDCVFGSKEGLNLGVEGVGFNSVGGLGLTLNVVAEPKGALKMSSGLGGGTDRPSSIGPLVPPS